MLIDKLQNKILVIVFSSFLIMACGDKSIVLNSQKDPENSKTELNSYQQKFVQLHGAKKYTELLYLMENEAKNKPFDLASGLDICMLKERLNKEGTEACYLDLHKQLKSLSYQQQKPDIHTVLVSAFAKVNGSQALIDEFLHHNVYPYSDFMQPFDRNKLIYTFYP